MAFFRKWKINYRHKKLNEDWGLSKSLKDLSESENGPSAADPTNEASYSIKYLGSTMIGSQRNQKATSSAIKSVIANSKIMRKKKDLRRVQLNVSPDGVRVVNEKTGELVLHVSIYKISYCSVDAAHDHIFSFVGSEQRNTADEHLSCYVFDCPKRQIAYDLTLKVAKCFEKAYHNWRDAVEREILRNAAKNEKNIISSRGAATTSVEGSLAKPSENAFNDVLIDLAKSFDGDDNDDGLTTNETVTNMFQNTWVSFDDDDDRTDPKQFIVY